VIVLDVRPAEEFAAGHIPGAISTPLADLDRVVARLLKRKEIVAYCRGPYCVLAPQTVERLRGQGRRARRLADGMPEWRRAGLPVAVGEACEMKNVLLILNDPPYGTERAGACFVELGDGQAAYATGRFWGEGEPQIHLRRPGRRWHAAKVAFEQYWDAAVVLTTA